MQGSRPTIQSAGLDVGGDVEDEFKPDFDEHLEADELGDTEEADSRPLPGRVKPADPWIEHDGKKIRKSTLCRVVIAPDYIRRSHELTLRVRDYPTDFKRRGFKAGDENVLKPDSFLVEGPFTYLGQRR